MRLFANLYLIEHNERETDIYIFILKNCMKQNEMRDERIANVVVQSWKMMKRWDFLRNFSTWFELSEIFKTKNVQNNMEIQITMRILFIITSVYTFNHNELKTRVNLVFFLILRLIFSFWLI